MRYFFLSFLICVHAKSQDLPSLWEKQNSRKPMAYPNLREADITWGKRVWRTIDLREKLNFPLRFPIKANPKKISLYEVLKNSIEQNQISIVRFDESEFQNDHSKDSTIEKIFIRNKKITLKDEFQNEYSKVISDTVRSEDIFQYFIIEDYFFDSKRSVMDSRIRAICPVRYNNVTEEFEAMFWVNYDECREILVNRAALNSKNDARTISFDDLFNKRMYNSFITKESNLFDRDISDYTKGIDALYEAERIKQSIYNFESDLWQY